MKKTCCILLSILLLFAALPSYRVSALSTKDLASTAVVLMDADTGEILFSKNRNKKLYPASITKILTGLLVVENSRTSETVKVKASATKLPKGYAHINLTSGEKLTVKSALYAMLLPSANDAANALAEHVAGSQKKFAVLMNARAKEIGAKNSNFVNASGIPNKNHYTTAYDMALITREASQNATFMKYFGASSYTLPTTNKQKKLSVKTYHYMLREDADEYNPDVIGGKIGYTGQAKHTMCTVAERDGRTLICVVMGSTATGKYDDTQLLLDYGFSLS